MSSIRKLYGQSSPGSQLVTATATVVRPSDIGRSYLYVRNIGAVDAFLCFSNNNDAEVDKGILLKVDEIYEMDADKITDVRLTAICAAGSTTLSYLIGM